MDEIRAVEIALPYDCWKLILNFMELDAEVQRTTRYPFGVDVWLLILRSVSWNLNHIIKRHQSDQDLVLGFRKEAVAQFLSSKGYLSCLKYFVLDLKYYAGLDTAKTAAAEGHFECLKLVHQANPTIDWKSMAQRAAQGGNYDCLVYCHQRGAVLTTTALETAAALGNLEMVKYIRSFAPTKLPLITIAVSNGQINILQYALDNGEELPEDICLTAIASRQHKTLVYLHAHGATIRRKHIKAAIEYGAYKCLKYLLEHMQINPGQEINFGSAPGLSGKIELLKQLREQGAVWGPNTVSVVLLRGDLECLRYVLETGAQATEGAYSQISRREDWVAYFELLQSYNVPHNPFEYVDCMEVGNLDCTIYLREACGLPWPPRMSEQTARYGNYEFFVYAYENGCTWHEETCIAAVKREDSDPRFLKYAHEHGAPWDSRVIYLAAKMGKLALLKYAHEMGLEWDQKMIREADLQGHKKCVEYMQCQGPKLVNTYSWDDINTKNC